MHSRIGCCNGLAAAGFEAYHGGGFDVIHETYEQRQERRMKDMIDAVMIDVGGLTRNKARKAVEAVLSWQRIHNNEDMRRWEIEQFEKQKNRGVKKVRGSKQG
ncbi:MAG: hypothetical protein F4Y03_12740 [Alphaproteobacteria bacterium]|nr:hypothetical protein [Alphaproteobacteria bacterium]